MNKLRYIFSESSQTVVTTIFLSLWGLTLTNLYLKIVNIIFSLLGWSPRTILRVNKVNMFKNFRRKLLKDNLKFEGTWWDGVVRVTWKIINWYHWIYNGNIEKAKLKIPITWACTVFPLYSFTVALVKTNIEKCDMQFVTATFASQYLWKK